MHRGHFRVYLCLFQSSSRTDHVIFRVSYKHITVQEQVHAKILFDISREPVLMEEFPPTHHIFTQRFSKVTFITDTISRGFISVACARDSVVGLLLGLSCLSAFGKSVPGTGIPVSLFRAGIFCQFCSAELPVHWDRVDPVGRAVWDRSRNL